MKTIDVSLYDVESINKAIAELKAYKKSLNDKCIKLIELMCREGEEYAKIRWLGHFWSGETADSVIGYRRGKIGVVAVGGNAVWVEFGTGLYAEGQMMYPGPLPRGIVGHGMYGKKKKGQDPDGWTYYDEFTGDFYHTKGHPTDPIMWQTARRLENLAADYAKKVFNG